MGDFAESNARFCNLKYEKTQNLGEKIVDSALDSAKNSLDSTIRRI